MFARKRGTICYMTDRLPAPSPSGSLFSRYHCFCTPVTARMYNRTTEYTHSRVIYEPTYFTRSACARLFLRARVTVMRMKGDEHLCVSRKERRSGRRSRFHNRRRTMRTSVTNIWAVARSVVACVRACSCAAKTFDALSRAKSKIAPRQQHNFGYFCCS